MASYNAYLNLSHQKIGIFQILTRVVHDGVVVLLRKVVTRWLNYDRSQLSCSTGTTADLVTVCLVSPSLALAHTHT